MSHLLASPDRHLAYLLTHPPAWGYSQEEVLFERNGDRRINFMPASELRYLLYMKKIEGAHAAWTPASDKEIATVISAKQIRAPYHRIHINGIPIPEPSLQDLLEPGILQKGISEISKPAYQGRPETADVKAGLNQLKSDIEQASLKRKRMNLRKTPTLAEVLQTAGIESKTRT